MHFRSTKMGMAPIYSIQSKSGSGGSNLQHRALCDRNGIPTMLIDWYHGLSRKPLPEYLNHISLIQVKLFAVPQRRLLTDVLLFPWYCNEILLDQKPWKYQSKLFFFVPEMLLAYYHRKYLSTKEHALSRLSSCLCDACIATVSNEAREPTIHIVQALWLESETTSSSCATPLSATAAYLKKRYFSCAWTPRSGSTSSSQQRHALL